MYDKSMEDKITIEYKGVKYHRYPKSKRRTHRVYYQHHGKWKEPPIFLHRKIYEDNFGPIPKGYHIHHKDGNTENNSPDNLEALPASVHATVYLNEMSDAQRAEYKKKLSDAQLARQKYKYICENCRKEFGSSRKGNVRFCSRECAKERNLWWEKAVRDGVAKCVWCDKLITKGRGRYCSQACRDAARRDAYSNIDNLEKL